MMDKKIRKLINDKNIQLPTLPVVANNILQLAEAEDTSAQDLADFIEQDPAISNRLLRLANSAFYGQVRTIDTVQRAVMVIGFDEVTRLALSIGVFSSFDLKGVEQILNMRNLWLHSISCAMTADAVAKLTGLKQTGHLFINGLLHDMGKVIFAIYISDDYADVLNSADERNLPLYMTEDEILGVDHAALAGHFMQEWNFPDSLILPVKYHHAPMKCPKEFQRHAMVVMVANFFCHKIGMGLSGTPSLDEVNTVLANLGLRFQDLKKVAEVLSANKKKIVEFLTFLS